MAQIVCLSLEKLGCYGYWSLMCTSIAMWIWLTAHWWQYVFQMVETYPMLSSSSTQSCQISTFMPFKFYIPVSKHLKIAFVMMLCHFPTMDIHNWCANTLYILCTNLFWPKHMHPSCSGRPSCFCTLATVPCDFDFLSCDLCLYGCIMCLNLASKSPSSVLFALFGAFFSVNVACFWGCKWN